MRTALRTGSEPAWRRALAPGLALAGLTLLIGLRAQAVERAHGAYSDCVGCLSRAVVLGDLRILAIMLAALTLAWLSRSRLWRGVLAFAAFLLSSLYLLDLGVFSIFGFRMQLADLLRYGGDGAAAWTVVRPLLAEARGQWLLAGWLLAAPVAVAAIACAGRSRRVVVAGLTAALGAWLAALAGTGPSYVHADVYADFIRVNRVSGVDRKYSPAHQAALLQTAALPTDCRQLETVPAAVILLVVESLSAYHSRLLGGVENSLPEIDRLARENSYFTEFHANGFTTDGGLIALLAGRVPLPAVGRYRSTAAYSGYERAFVPDAYARLHEAGYQTGFFTAGDLSFLNKGKWLRELGFAHVEGAEHRFYDGLPRGGFRDAGDRALYQRYLDWYDHERGAQPHLSVLLTVSSHPPFFVPGTQIRGEHEAMRWADAQVGDFVRELRTRGYFEHGILLITGDHRTMTVVRPHEQQHFGEGAMSRVPAVVIGAAGLPPGPVSGRWQQTDFLGGLLAVAGQRSCTDAFHGRLLGADAQPAQFVVHGQGMHRDRALVWERGHDEPWSLILDGDDTRWLTSPPQPMAHDVLTHLSRARAQLDAVEPDLMPRLVEMRRGASGPAEPDARSR